MPTTVPREAPYDEEPVQYVRTIQEPATVGTVSLELQRHTSHTVIIHTVQCTETEVSTGTQAQLLGISNMDKTYINKELS